MIPTPFGRDGRRDHLEDERVEAELVHLNSAIDEVPIPKNTTRIVYVNPKQEKRRKHSAIQFNQFKEQESGKRSRSYRITPTPIAI